MNQVQTYDPRSGEQRDAGFPETAPHEVTATCALAAEAAVPFGDLGAWPLDRRADALRAVAGRIEAHTEELAALADEETALGLPRLTNEIVRTVEQLRLFARVVDDGTFLEVAIDAVDPGYRPAPRPDLRRMLQPIGPVAVFGASNFPFAFSVAGGDTASALAAGCPVVVKTHEGHPRTSARTAELVTAALGEAGAHEGTFAVVYGREAGRELVTDRFIRAVGFTGSLRGGRALFDLAVSRPDPIPFYGKLGSLNPVVVTRAAVAARPAEIVEGFVGSLTLGTGQFCTKPGLLFLPSGHGLDGQLAAALTEVPAGPLLTPTIRAGFRARTDELAGSERVDLLAPGEVPDEDLHVVPRLYRTSAAAVVGQPTLVEECFGPAALVVEWDDYGDLDLALSQLPGSLTATIHAEADDRELVERLLLRLRRVAGRIIWNGWPTGVAVTGAMHHGGPWPSTTNPLHTSVGATAVRRFLVPVVYQGFPQGLLPEILRD